MSVRDNNLFDVAVVGCGPAGASAAHDLAKAGAQVLLIEKESLPRYKTCGGGVIHRAFQRMPERARAAVERECRVAELNFLEQGFRFAARREVPIIYMTMRPTLDHLLAVEAQNAGAQLETGCAVISIREREDSIELETSKGQFLAKFVIAADGANSVLAKRCGWADLPCLIPALECEVFVRESDFNRLSGAARFDFGIIPEGYAWVFPKKEHLSIGVLSMRRGRVNLPELLQKYLQVLEIPRPEKTERHGYVIPVRPRAGPLARGRVLLVGDAAGLVDPVTAEGITFAIRSGQLAAHALTSCQFDPSKTSQCYQTHARTELLSELKVARIIAWILYRQPRIASYLMKIRGSSFTERMTDVMMGATNYRSEFRKLGNYLRLLGMAGRRQRSN